MNPATTASYLAVTEQPRQPASRIQLDMLEARYAWAAGQAGGKDVLEAACGAGMGLPGLAKVARSVQAGDVDPENLSAARRACAGHSDIQPSNITLAEFCAEELPYPQESFDLLLLFEAVYYLRDTGRFLAEARRVLRPGGRLLIVTVNPQWTGFNPSPLMTRYWSSGELLTALHEAGFAARVQGAFRETSSATAAAIRLIRRLAVALDLIPRTMQGKALLKRIFYGRLREVPALLQNSGLSPRLEEIGAAGTRHHRVLYATALKVL